MRSTPSARPRRRSAQTPLERASRAWLRRFYAYFNSKRLVAAELLKHSGADDPVFGTGYARVLDAGRPLLLAAQASGETRSTLTLEQILDMVAAIAKIPGDAGYREPILQAALDSLVRSGTSPVAAMVITGRAVPAPARSGSPADRRNPTT